MNNRIVYFLSIFFCLFLLSCKDADVDFTLKVAGVNSKELQKVLDLYKDADEEKYEAAKFLISNMAGHYTTYSPAIDSFALKINKADTIVADTLYLWWDNAKQYDKQQKLYDAKTISADFLSDNIDKAMKTWKTSKWADEVDFNMFCNYILPYRLREEVLAPIGWRDSLYNRYYHLVDSVSDMGEAYTIIYNYILKEMPIKPIGHFPYLLNPIDAGKVLRGKCLNQCVYMASVMRALGIPAVVDGVSRWANYSKTGHSWVALIKKDGTYTVALDDSVARKMNPVDATVFPLKKSVEKDFPIDLSFMKKAVKIWRSEYAVNNENTYNDSNAVSSVFKSFTNRLFKDVSDEYGIVTDIEVSSDSPSEYCYLCTFTTGGDWQPIFYAKKRWWKYVFKNVADSVVYLPMVYDKERVLQPIGNPFIVTENGHREIVANFEERQSMEINRKYPFAKTMVKTWIDLKGSHFEGSNDVNFHNADTIYKLLRTPIYGSTFNLSDSKKYRYIKFVSNPKRRSPIMEMEFYVDGKLLRGKPFANGALMPENCFDGDTYNTMKNIERGYSVGCDFGKPVAVDKIILYLRNDGNYVVPGDEYELSYYDKGRWVYTRAYKSKGHKLVYKNVPSGALYVLRNRTKGSEERIFTYENGKQVWW